MSSRPDRPARPRRRRSTDRSGFTLIEVLVAMTVLATLLSVMYRSVVGLRAGSNTFDRHTQEEIVARAVLEEALGQRDLKNGTLAGERDGHRWTIKASTIDLASQFPKPPPKNPPPGNQGGGPQPGSPQPGSPQAGASPTGQPGQPPQPQEAQKPKIDWRPQRVVVRVEGIGRPAEVEAIRLVRVDP